METIYQAKALGKIKKKKNNRKKKDNRQPVFRKGGY